MDGLRAVTRAIAAQGAIPVTLGGEHGLSYGAVMGVVQMRLTRRLVLSMSMPVLISAMPIKGISILMPASCICWR